MLKPSLKINSTYNTEMDIKNAEMIGEFSLDKNRKFCKDNKENLKFLKNYKWYSDTPEMVAFDLNKDYDRRVAKDSENKERLDNILHWIVLNKEKLYIQEDNIRRIFPDLVCYRGRISQILDTPYNTEEAWIFEAIKYRGTIYTMGVETEKKRAARLAETEREKRMSAWGFKFEQCILGEDGPVNENEEYNCVFKTEIGSHSILAVAEVDAADHETYKEKKDDIRSFLEFKTNKLLSLPNAEKTFCRFKPRKWWAQSAIIGIPEVICGFRSNDGIVSHTKPFNVTQLPYYNGEKLFEPTKMLNFTLRFLDWMKEIIVQEYPVVYRIKRDEYSENITYEISPMTPFITDEYIKEMFN